MTTSQIIITNTMVPPGPLSLDVWFGERRQLRTLLPIGGTVDIAHLASYEEVNQNEALYDLRTAGKISITTEAGLDDLPGVGANPYGSHPGIKYPVRAATTANITLSGTQTIDTVALAVGDRVLVKDQTAPEENGIYVVAAADWSRASDANDDAEVPSGMRVTVSEGGVAADSEWVLTTNDPIVLGTTSLTFAPHTAAALAGVAPADVDVSAAAVGVAITAARTDHKHNISTAAPAQGIGASNGVGTATSLARSDHNHTIRESGGQDLTTGAMADGAIVQRSGTTLAAATPIANIPISRYTLGADSTLAADVIGATTETIHTALTLTAADLGTARRLVKFYARLHVISSNAADTWTFRVRLGGLAGTLILASTAIDIANDDVYAIEGFVEIRTTGAGGTFDSFARFTDVANATADVWGPVIGGAVDTTGSRTLVITGECSSANAGNQVSLRHFSAEVMAA